MLAGKDSLTLSREPGAEAQPCRDTSRCLTQQGYPEYFPQTPVLEPPMWRGPLGVSGN